MKFNKNPYALPKNYVFNEIREKAAELKKTSGIKLIDLGVGDVKLPLFPATVSAMAKAAEELGNAATFKGYPPAEGYLFLREKIAEKRYGSAISPDEIFVTDGAKGELGSVTELFERGIKVGFTTPCYPAALEANIALGNEVKCLKVRKEDDYQPLPPQNETFDVIYLCSPCNPTGATISRENLRKWVEYATDENAVLIFDAAYSDFASGDEVKSVYEIPRAKECAIEINSFSKSMGFTGVRCGYTVVPKAVGKLYEIKKRLQNIRTNGVSYISQRGAETYFLPEVENEIKKRVEFYKTNADVMKIALKNANLWYNNGRSSPYVFFACPDAETSERFCDRLLYDFGIISTPGSGFGEGGEGYVRLSAFCSRSDALAFSDRMRYF